MRTIEFLDASGHLALEWDPTDPESVEKAHADFVQLRQAGYSFFRVARVDNFDSEHGALEVRRVEPSEVEPRIEALAPPEPRRARGRPRGSTNKPTPVPERVVAARPMRGG